MHYQTLSPQAPSVVHSSKVCPRSGYPPCRSHSSHIRTWVQLRECLDIRGARRTEHDAALEVFIFRGTSDYYSRVMKGGMSCCQVALGVILRRMRRAAVGGAPEGWNGGGEWI